MYPSQTRFAGDLFAEFDGLQRHLEQLLGLRGMPSSIRAAGRGAFPAINMGSTEEAVEIYAFAPGIDPAKVEVSVDKGLLTISGERAVDTPEEGEKVSVYAQERFTGSFKRVVSLPEDVDTLKVDASYRNGVLKIVIPKREASRPRRIEVRE
ncbi:MAG TPA: Hsp20/alpha crystallin family protein [Usitatibacter sp.]|nr:Hsp20/alpha crystallin family protein [Usitatibacter sp.]